MPERIQMTRNRPWRAEHPDAVIVDRRTKYGNVFAVGALIRDPGWNNAPACPYDGPLREGDYGTFVIRRVRDAADAVALLRDYVEFHDDEYPIEEIRRDLAGRDVACWCKLTDPCHGDLWMELANA